MVPYENQTLGINELIPYDENIINIRKKIIPYDENIIQNNKIVSYDKSIKNHDNKVLISYERLNRNVLKLIENRIIEN